MSEPTVPTVDKCVEAAERHRRIATIGDVCAPALRTASTTRALSPCADPASAVAVFRQVREPMRTMGLDGMGVDGMARLDVVTAR
ncbi:hypothetical protein [Nocardia africana]|uniref:Uncharacterized protein n=1 Tax=Nocardia africana TaxID=134964 RepID=A0A378WM04_9NOCA|nr:hypothetical protein [Nocardia africana]MCC3315734.1 hypothetical protein [Nocardia africana]SUA41952.1 Uncharacterised protein [Nocardia africana]